MSPAIPMRLALVGNPNCGKTALFNRLTGARQKVANYAGVTVERKEGQFTSAVGRAYQVIDLPGAYSLNAMTPDEAITRDVLFGTRADEMPPDVIVLVADANNLRLNLRLVLEVMRLQRPMVLVLNMMDVAQKNGLVINLAKLQAELGIPVVQAIAVKPGGDAELVARLDSMVRQAQAGLTEESHAAFNAGNTATLEATQREVRRILDAVIDQHGRIQTAGDRIDAIVMHPVLGYVILAVLLFLIFQAVFSWSAEPMALIKGAVDGVGRALQATLPAGILRSLLVDGVLSGVGSVLVFLPQILILFLFILTLEDSGYLPRAAFLVDQLMGSVGVPFELTSGLDAAWGYRPSLANMRALLDLFAFDRGLVSEDLAELRYQASIRPGFQESFAAMFPAPRQRWIEELCSDERAIRALPHPTLVVHGREDQIIPLQASLTLAQWIPNAQLHVFDQCGHWTQIEHAERFARLVEDFLAEAAPLS